MTMSTAYVRRGVSAAMAAVTLQDADRVGDGAGALMLCECDGRRTDVPRLTRPRSGLWSDTDRLALRRSPCTAVDFGMGIRWCVLAYRRWGRDGVARAGETICLHRVRRHCAAVTTHPARLGIAHGAEPGLIVFKEAAAA